MKKYYLRVKNNILYYLIYLMFIILVCENLNSKSLIGDEPFTFHIIDHKFLDIINLTAQDVHPFLYYFIAKAFTYNINNIMMKIIMLKLISVLPYLILLIIGNTYIKNNFSKLTSQIFMLSIISMPIFIDNISFVRMYGWATLFTIIFYCIFMHAYNNNNNIRNFVLLSVFALMASYTHYYALMTVAIIYFIFLILFISHKMKLKYIILSIFIDLLLYLPWMFVIINQAKKATNNYWSSKIAIKDVLHMSLGVVSPVHYFSIFYIWPLLLLIFLSIVIFDKNIKKDKMFIVNIIHLFIPFILILCGILASIIVSHSLLITRYIMPAMGIFWLAISIIIGKIHNNKMILKWVSISIIILISFISYSKTIINDIVLFNKINTSVNVIRNLPQNSSFIYDNSNIMYDFSIYVNNNNILKVPQNDKSFPIYNKVFNNIKINNGIDLPNNYKNLFYVKGKYNDPRFTSKLSIKFKNKYKMKKVDEIFLNEGIAEIYKIIPSTH